MGGAKEVGCEDEVAVAAVVADGWASFCQMDGGRVARSLEGSDAIRRVEKVGSVADWIIQWRRPLRMKRRRGVAAQPCVCRAAVRSSAAHTDAQAAGVENKTQGRG